MKLKVMFNRKILKIVTLFLINMLISSQYFAQLPPLSTGWETTKRGGIAFRVGGNQPLDKLNAYSQLFTDKGYNFSFAMGLGGSEFNDPDYVQGIKDLQALGHKLFDLTPNFRINYFYTKFDTLNYTASDSVDHNTGIKICLKYMDVVPAQKLFEGTADITNNLVTVSNSNTFQKFDYLYFPNLLPDSQLVLITNIDTNTTTLTLSIKNVWNDAINLGNSTAEAFQYFNYLDIHMAPEALVLLGKETRKLAKLYGIQRPYRFITPGTGDTPWGITPAEIKSTFGDELGYVSAQAYVDHSLKTYNEYNLDGVRPFGMTWGQFREETQTLGQIKEKIADGIAKHYVLFNSSHFLGDYYINTTEILQWCHDNNIPVLTATEWTDVLYNTPQGSDVNIFPPLNVDLDGNGFPDGYYTPNSYGILLANDGPPESGNVCYSIQSQERICYVSGLGGLEEGENDFEIWTKGDIDGQVTIYFNVGGIYQVFIFPVNTTDWTRYDLSQTTNGNHSLILPETVSRIDISIYSNSTNEVRIGGMSLKKHNPTPVELTSFTASESDLGIKLDWTTATEVNNYGFEIERTSSLLSTNYNELNDSSSIESSEWETIGFVEGHGNSYSPKVYSYVDSFSLGGEVKYRLKQIDTDGIFEYSSIVTVNSSIVSVELSDDMKTNLYQNHPNPFNPSTIISYQLANSAYVSLKVYDIIGNEVAILISNEKQTPGSHSVEFNKLNNGRKLSSGVYFYQINAGPYVETKKMLLLK